MTCRGLLTAGLLCLSAAATADNVEPAFGVGGLLFGDLYYVPSQHLESGDGAAGLVLRRGYLTFDATLSEHWFGRLRFEVNQSGEFETYTFKTRFKDLYTGWNLGRQRLLLGLSPTPTFDLIESIWDYRYLARTPLDLQGEPSRDTGISLKGPLNASGTLAYRVMLGAKVKFGGDSDDQRKLMAALTWKPAPEWTLDFYAGHGQQTAETTLQAFVSYQTNTLTWGAQYSHMDRGRDPSFELASAFLRRPMGANQTLVGRIDRLVQPSPEGNGIAYLPFDPSAPATMFIGGMEFETSAHFSITPNIVVTRYDRNEEGVRPKTDAYLRLTLFVNFE